MNADRRRSLAPPARILIVDDHPMMREGLAAQISDQPDLEVCGQAEGSGDAIAAIESTRPHLAIVDIALRDSNGIALIKDIRARFPDVRTMVLSVYPDSLYAERALRAGAMGYLNKQEPGETVLEAIRTVLAGKRYVTPDVAQRLIGLTVSNEPGQGSPIETLTDRELEVFRMIGEGLTTGAIASRLHLSPHTIDTHRENIKLKLGARTAGELRREATQWLLESGF